MKLIGDEQEYEESTTGGKWSIDANAKDHTFTVRWAEEEDTVAAGKILFCDEDQSTVHVRLKALLHALQEIMQRQDEREGAHA